MQCQQRNTMPHWFLNLDKPTVTEKGLDSWDDLMGIIDQIRQNPRLWRCIISKFYLKWLAVATIWPWKHFWGYFHDFRLHSSRHPAVGRHRIENILEVSRSFRNFGSTTKTDIMKPFGLLLINFSSSWKHQAKCYTGRDKEFWKFGKNYGCKLLWRISIVHYSNWHKERRQCPRKFLRITCIHKNQTCFPLQLRKGRYIRQSNRLLKHSFQLCVVWLLFWNEFDFQSEILFYEIPYIFRNFPFVTVPIYFAQVVDVFCKKKRKSHESYAPINGKRQVVLWELGKLTSVDLRCIPEKPWNVGFENLKRNIKMFQHPNHCIMLLHVPLRLLYNPVVVEFTEMQKRHGS